MSMPQAVLGDPVGGQREQALQRPGLPFELDLAQRCTAAPATTCPTSSAASIFGTIGQREDTHDAVDLGAEHLLQGHAAQRVEKPPVGRRAVVAIDVDGRCAAAHGIGRSSAFVLEPRHAVRAAGLQRLHPPGAFEPQAQRDLIARQPAVGGCRSNAPASARPRCGPAGSAVADA
jgi:hypothetical protein